MKNRESGNKAFTLIELIVVVIIIGILATFAVPEYLKATERAKIGKAKNALKLIADAEKMYRAQYDEYTTVPATWWSPAGGSPGNSFTTILGGFIELSGIESDPDWQYKACVDKLPVSTDSVNCTQTGGAKSPSGFVAVARRTRGKCAHTHDGDRTKGFIVVDNMGNWVDMMTNCI